MNGRAVRFETRIFCKVDSYQCGVNYKFPWMDAAMVQLSEFEREFKCWNCNEQAGVLLIVHRVGSDVKVTLYEIKKETNGCIVNKWSVWTNRHWTSINRILEYYMVEW